METKNYILTAEHYKTVKLLNKYPELSLVLKDVIDKSTAELIVLFGSYAKFIAKTKSDIDLLVLSKK